MNEYIINDLYEYKNYSYLDDVMKEIWKEENVKNTLVSILFVGEEEIRDINHETRGINRVTDVISFALEDGEEIPENVTRVLGDIYICIPKMKEQAIEYGHSEKRELSFLVTHGMLHLLGYDHQTNEEEEIMFSIQNKVLESVNILR